MLTLNKGNIKVSVERGTGFFRIALSHDSLENHFKTNFALMQHHKYSLSELEAMVPWEREIYINLLLDFLKEEKERREEQMRRRK